MFDAKRFGEILKGLREREGLTQTELAEKSQVPIGTIRDYEQNRREPLFSTAARLAAALGVDCTAFTQEPAASPEPRPRGRPKGKPAVEAPSSAAEPEKGKKTKKRKES